MKKQQKLESLNIEEWRASSRKDVINWLQRDEKQKRQLGASLIIRTQLKPVDVYCYLKARFGEPNGFQNVLRRDDSDNWIHWDYNLKAGAADVYFAGTSREIHIMISEALTDSDWKDFIVGMKNDFGRFGKQKSEVLRSFEKYVVFQNKFVSIAHLCADLHADILDAPDRPKFPKNMLSPHSEGDTMEKAVKSIASRADKLHGDSLKLRLLMPIMAEAFINMMILMFTRDEIRNDSSAYQAFVRAKIPDRLALLSNNCDGFQHGVDKNTDAYAQFMRVIEKRNFALHGNVDPLREPLETVYFDGRRPLFSQSGNHIEHFLNQLENLHRPMEVVTDYEAVHMFLWELTECLKPSFQEFFQQVLDDTYPGFEVHKKRVTRILPDTVMMGVLPRMRYDDDLNVEW